MDTVKNEFTTFVLDQLGGLGEVEARPMFRGFGLYARGPIFGIIHRRRLYFRVSDASRPGYEARGAKPFRPYAGHVMRTYSEVPPAILEDAAALVAWARVAEAVPRTGRQAARRPERPRGPRRGTR